MSNVRARSNRFEASPNDTRVLSATTRSGNIDGDTAASSANRPAAATSIESSHPRTRRTSPNNRSITALIGTSHIDRSNRFDQPDNRHHDPLSTNTISNSAGECR